MNCKNCKFGNFSKSSDRFRLSGYGVCDKLVAQTISGAEDNVPQKLAAIELQPLAFSLDYVEIGIASNPISVHRDFGCILFQRKRGE